MKNKKSEFSKSTSPFKLCSKYEPRGDQPNAIKSLLEGVNSGISRQVLLGATGTGKTFTAANVIASLNRPSLVIAHNKTLAAQLYSEFKELFPENAVRYFVSYYDYYQPEAYIPSTDTYIEKDAAINEEIDKLRHAATKALLERRDVIVVASVSCIYGLGAPDNYFDMMLYLECGDEVKRNDVLRQLVKLQFQRNDIEFRTGTFRVRGDVVDVCPADETDNSLRIVFFGDEIEELSEIDRLTGKTLRKLDKICIYPASHFVTSEQEIKRAVGAIQAELKIRLDELNRQGKLLEAQRLEQRTLYDLELLQEMGFCPGIENYSRHLTNRQPGEAPPTLIDYFPEDFLVFIDECHVSVPQIAGMYRGDFSRKSTLVDHGFRLPSAIDNRPLRFDEFAGKAKQIVYISATPSQFELDEAKGRVIEQINRPTGLVDPQVVVRPATNQVDDFLEEVRLRASRGERVLVTTLTKRMSEDLCEYYREVGVRVRYLHSDIHTLDRVDLIRGLREGEFDLLVGINLLREGLDLPEVSLIGIMDADKEGFLRSTTSIIQTIGRAARHLEGKVILYADRITRSIEAALNETNRRRKIQEEFNATHGIIPQSVKRAKEAELVESPEIEAAMENLGALEAIYGEKLNDIKSTKAIIEDLRTKMFEFAKELEFEKAAELRDQINLLERGLLFFEGINEPA